MNAAGTVGYLDLTKERTRVEPLPPDWRRRFIGGRGIHAYLAFDQIRSGIGPLASGNSLILGTGILSGLGAGPLECAGFSTRFPITGRYDFSVIPGGFGTGLRWAGLEHLVISGRARHLVAIRIQNGDICVESAAGLKGKDAPECIGILGRGGDARNLRGIVIGPEGETRSKSAPAVVFEGMHFGEYGAGAVMGAKNIKAVFCNGVRDLPVKHPRKFLDRLKEILDSVEGVRAGSFQLKAGLKARDPRKTTVAQRETVYRSEGRTLSAETVHRRIAHSLGIGWIPGFEEGVSSNVLESFGELVRMASGWTFNETRLVEIAFTIHALERLHHLRDGRNPSKRQTELRPIESIQEQKGWSRRSLMGLKAFKDLDIEELWPRMR